MKPDGIHPKHGDTRHNLEPESKACSNPAIHGTLSVRNAVTYFRPHIAVLRITRVGARFGRHPLSHRTVPRTHYSDESTTCQNRYTTRMRHYRNPISPCFTVTRLTRYPAKHACPPLIVIICRNVLSMNANFNYPRNLSGRECCRHGYSTPRALSDFRLAASVSNGNDAARRRKTNKSTQQWATDV